MDNFKSILINLMVVSAVITGILQFQGGILNQYGDVDEIDTGPLRRIASLSDETYGSVESNLTETIEKVGSENIVESLWYTGKSVFTGLTIMLMAIPAVTGITAEAFTYGIMPAWFASLITIVVTIIILLLLISFVVKRSEGLTKR